eukprot:CAMPEP_0181201358 /NCGR_PEP_ID=MMETSP1096-20121128/18263_1 /TAXON_ID=156174 ORGANISM="Chrysochromulina ericina, Strain CCMP281" /NCGR_SAMPLE_ID=MMETSP1096 /ASSEMBLY_ACC=CAM_ASM_000453 /LENGTH=129 /DNA_ID=CAMNT_0023291793 /DNA_START=49 /DNA_END=438 /DNA_ORIENTATION=-
MWHSIRDWSRTAHLSSYLHAFCWHLVQIRAFELIYLLRGGPDGVWVTLGVLLEFGIKLGMLFPAMKLHDLLPEKRAPRVEPAQLQAQMAAVVQQVLSEHLERLKTRPATVQRPPAVTPEDGADGSWDTV